MIEKITVGQYTATIAQDDMMDYPELGGLYLFIDRTVHNKHYGADITNYIPDVENHEEYVHDQFGHGATIVPLYMSLPNGELTTAKGQFSRFIGYVGSYYGMGHIETSLNVVTKWSRGEVYAYTIKDGLGDVIDSCGGFYDYNECVEEARMTIEGYAKKEVENAARA